MGLVKLKGDESNLAERALAEFLEQGQRIIVGKEEQLRLAFCCLLARGHLLIEDIPGVGKTTMVKFLASSLGLKANRIQFTNDLLPGDIIGSSVFEREKARFEFHPGPLFSEIVVADELNRATPKTQSACLQAMEERQITVDGVTHHLPEPFFVIATQNPQNQMGTYPLPESQLDRFLMSLHLGYPDSSAEKSLLRGEPRQELLTKVRPVLDIEQLAKVQNLVQTGVHASDAIVDYVHRLVVATRGREDCYGLSPRAGIALMAAAKSMAILAARTWVAPEDVQAVFAAVAGHRLIASEGSPLQQGWRLSLEIMEKVKVD